MDTPGHVSERDGQEEDENKWCVRGGEEKKKKGYRVKDTNARESTAKVVMCEQVIFQKEERDGVREGLECHGTYKPFM